LLFYRKLTIFIIKDLRNLILKLKVNVQSNEENKMLYI